MSRPRLLPRTICLAIRRFRFRIGLGHPGLILWWDIKWGNRVVGRIWHIVGKPVYWSRDVYENYRGGKR